MPEMTHTDVEEMLEERRDTLSDLHTEMEIDERFVNASARWGDNSMADYLTGLPKEGYRAKVPPLALNAVTVNLNQTTTAETPSVKVLLPPRQPGDRRNRDALKKQAEDLEKALQALLWYLDTSSAESPIHSLMFNGVGYGLGVLAFPIAWDRWPDDPFLVADGRRRKPVGADELRREQQWLAKRARGLPWSIKNIHPRRAFFDTDHELPENMITEEDVPLRSYARRYPHLKDKLSGKLRGTGKLVTYVSEEEYGLWLDGHACLTDKDGANESGVAPNRTGVLWYSQVMPAMGQRSYDNEFVYSVKGILRDARDLLGMKMSAINQMSVITGTYAFPGKNIHGPSEEEAEDAARRHRYGPGVVNYYGPGFVVDTDSVPDIPRAVLQMIEQLDQLIEVHLGPRILRGAYDADATATQSSQRLAQAKAPLRRAIASGQDAVADMLMKFCRMIKSDLNGILFPSKAGDALMELRAKDIPDGIRILVDFTPPTHEDLVAEMVDRRERLGLELISKQRTMEADPEIEDVEAELEQILSEKIDASEPMMAIYTQEAAAIVQAALAKARGEGPNAVPPEAPAEPVAPEAGAAPGAPAAVEAPALGVDLNPLNQPAANGANPYGGPPVQVAG